jgi:hypothetical protein
MLIEQNPKIFELQKITEITVFVMPDNQSITKHPKTKL